MARSMPVQGMSQEFVTELTFEQRLDQIDRRNKKIAQRITAEARELVEELIERKQPHVAAFLQAGTPATPRKSHKKEGEERTRDTKSPEYRLTAALASEVAERDGISLHEDYSAQMAGEELDNRVRECVRNVPEPVLGMLGIADSGTLFAEPGQQARQSDAQALALEGEIRPHTITESLRMQLWQELGMVNKNHLEEILRHGEFTLLSSAVPEHMQGIRHILSQIQLQPQDVRAFRNGLKPGASPDAIQTMLVTRQRLCNRGFIAEPVETYMREMEYGLRGEDNPSGERVLVVGLMDKRKRKKNAEQNDSRLYALGTIGLYPTQKNYDFIRERSDLLFGKSDGAQGEYRFNYPHDEQKFSNDAVLSSTLRIGLIAVDREKPAVSEFAPHFLLHHMLELVRSLRPQADRDAHIFSEVTEAVMIGMQGHLQKTGLINRAGKRITDAWEFEGFGRIWNNFVPSSVHDVDGEQVPLHGYHELRGGKFADIHAQACMVRRNILVAFGKARREDFGA